MNKTFCILIFISLFLFDSCKKKEVNTKTVVETLESGTWSVSYYTLANIDKTADLDKYILTFNPNDTVTATNLGTTTKGTWNYNSDQNVLHLSFTATTLLNEISNGWLVILKTDSEFIFDEDSSANDEELHINKN
ncbi:MAG: hypothetical protein WCI97_02120 [Bacteroidota bacterium]